MSHRVGSSALRCKALGVVALLSIACSNPPEVIVPDPMADAHDDADPMDAVLVDAPADDGSADRAETRQPRDADGRCTTSDDCVDLAGTPACDLTAGRCVRCTAADDRCPADEHCDDGSHLCVPGCRSDEGCGGGDAGRSLYCNVATRACVACLRDEHCVRGYCVAGGCVPWCEPDRGCGASQSCCSRTCADLLTNPMHCGACDAACPAGPRSTPTCTRGVCGQRCEADFADCNLDSTDGCEVNTRASTSHCGACGNACPTGANASPACDAGRCALTCATSFADCNGRSEDGCEVDTRVAVTHCGACGAACATVANGTPVCARGMCMASCDAGFADCNGRVDDGCEVDTRTSASNCGLCGAACPARPNAAATCTGAACQITCNTGFADCNGRADDGCEVDTRSSTSHCGQCGMACAARPNAAASCVSGACQVTCNAGFANCNVRADDGCEIDTRTARTHCGACGAVCSARANTTAECSAGVCARTCVAPFLDCNGRADDGCEADISSDANSCGACGRACGFLQGCVASDCGFVGLVGYWSFDGNGNDLAGTRPLRIVGSPTFSGGVFGQGLSLPNNAAQYADRAISDAAFELGASDFTLQLWVNFNGSTAQQTLIERWGPIGPGWTFGRLADGSLQWYGAPSAVLTSAPLSIVDRVWHHLVVRRRGSSFALFYDGASVATATNAVAIPALSNPLIVGRRFTGIGPLPLDGRLDELAIWSRALTNEEIVGIYNGGAGRPIIP
jgi:hypothetical protein